MAPEAVADAIAAARRLPERRQQRIVDTCLRLAEAKVEFTEAELVILQVGEALLDDGIEPSDGPSQPFLQPRQHHGLERTLRTPGTFEVKYPHKRCDLCRKEVAVGRWMRRHTNNGRQMDTHYPSCP